MDRLVKNEKPIRIAIVVSHPIQYFVPFYRKLSEHPELHLKVFYGARVGLNKYEDKDFGVEFAWSMDLLEGYDSEFLSGSEKVTDTRFFSVKHGDIDVHLENFNPHVVVIYGYSQLLSIKTLYWCYRKSIPVLMSSDSELLQHRAWYKKAVKRLLLPLLFSKVRGFLVVGDNNESYYRYYGVNSAKLFRCPFTIDEDSFQRARCNRVQIRKRWRAENRISEDVFVVLFAGKFTQKKRPNDLLEAIDVVSNNRPVCAVFAGDGPLMQEMKKQASQLKKNSCLFLGFVNIDKLPDVYVSADVLAVPSEKEPYGLVTCEAVAVGLPLIVSDKVGSVGPTDTVRAEENAIVYPCGDVRALADAIVRLAENPPLRQGMGRKSLQIADELGMSASVRGFMKAVKSACVK